ncbi:hypothetical protein CXG81DRAFT_3716, partial [Caulochytrium protostelioides]
LVFMPETYFVNDHRQGFREQQDPELERLVPPDAGAGLAAPSATMSAVADDDTDLTPAEFVRWRREQVRRLKMRRELFPGLPENTVIYANFNQLYKIDIDIFRSWLEIIRRVPNAILWLLRFPPAGEMHLRRTAERLHGAEVAQRVVFTDVAPKHQHIHRGRIADVFLDTPECNAHTTAADILWSGTPLVTYPKYDFKMCSRVAASVAYATGAWPPARVPAPEYDAAGRPMSNGLRLQATLPRLRDPLLLGHYMVVNSYQEYEDRAVQLGRGLHWDWVTLRAPGASAAGGPIAAPASAAPAGATGVPAPTRGFPGDPPGLPAVSATASVADLGFLPSRAATTHIFVPRGLAAQLRRQLFLTRDTMPLFNTVRWVRGLEHAFVQSLRRWRDAWDVNVARNLREYEFVKQAAER